MVTPQALVSLIPLLSLLIFIFGLGFYWLSAFFVLYHLIRFGIGTKPKRLSFLFLFGSLILSVLVTVLFINLNLDALSRSLFQDLQ